MKRFETELRTEGFQLQLNPTPVKTFVVQVNICITMMSNEAMDKANSKYGMRAPPRRRIKTEDSDDQPVFLRKAFVMMSQCPPEIGK